MGRRGGHEPQRGHNCSGEAARGKRERQNSDLSLSSVLPSPSSDHHTLNSGSQLIQELRNAGPKGHGPVIHSRAEQKKGKEWI